MIREAHDKRNIVSQSKQLDETILISDRWLTELQKFSFISSKSLLFHTFREARDWSAFVEVEMQIQEEEKKSNI